MYTGNMVVDGVPNALLENGGNGEGVFLRPGQHWKNLRLVSVKEDTIEVEGPEHEMKTIHFDDKSLGTSSTTSGALQPLPPAAIQGNLPAGPSPQATQPNGRRQRGQQANQANADALIGPIGNGTDLEASIDDTTSNTNNTRKNRRIKGNQ